MLIPILITLIILYFSYKKPIYAAVMILNINTIRAVPELDFSKLYFRSVNDASFYFSLFLPMISYLLMFISIKSKTGKLKYSIGNEDIFFIGSSIIMFLYSFISSSIIAGLEFTFKYILIGMPLYFIVKVILLNSSNFEKEYLRFYKGTIIASILTGSLGLYLANYVNFIEPFYGINNVPIARVTIPGVHPIPYSQAIGFGILIIFSSFYSNGKTLELKKKLSSIFLLGIFVYLVFLLLLANTRGVLISLFIAILFYIRLYPKRISKKNMRLLIFIFIAGVIFAVNFIDIERLFNRLINSFNNDTSASARMVLLKDAFYIVFTNPVGVGTYGFEHGYPHNIFLDYIVSFGVFGWILSIVLFVLIVYYYILTFNRRKRYPALILLYSFIIYFFAETQISFTLWMHKGLYMSIGLFTTYIYMIKKKEINELKK